MTINMSTKISNVLDIILYMPIQCFGYHFIYAYPMFWISVYPNSNAAVPDIYVLSRTDSVHTMTIISMVTIAVLMVTWKSECFD